MSDPGPAAAEPSRLGTGCGLFFLGVIGFMLVVAVITALDNDVQEVSAADFGSDWPLTVEDGTLVCSFGQVTFVHEDVEYALNPVAQMTGLYEMVEPLRADAGATSGKKSLDPLIDTGLEICGP
jgi:hypothetical protein